jgi:hypothetical protein
MVPLVANHLLACRDLGHELVAEDRNVMHRGLVRFTHPNEAILKLAVKTSLARLVQVMLWVLGQSWVAGLIDVTAMCPIDRDDEDWIVVIIQQWMAMCPVLCPNNLVAQMKQEGKKC